MKELYKIFGLEEGASFEEVTARYMELKKQLTSAAEKRHKMGITREEINEAYRKIKMSKVPRVVRLDVAELLKRQYQARIAENRKARLKKIFLTSDVVAVCLVLGAIIFTLEKPAKPRPWFPAPEGPDQKIRRSLEEEPRSPAWEAKTPAGIPEKAPEKPDEPAVVESPKPPVKVAERIETAKLSAEKPSGISGREAERMGKKEEPVTSPALKPGPLPEAEKAPPPGPMKAVLPGESKPVPEKIARKDEAGSIPRESAIASIPRGEEVKIKEEGPAPPASRTGDGAEAARMTLRGQERTGGADRAKVPEQKKAEEQTASISKPSSTIASDEEVRRFFSDYMLRYNRLQIGDFISFFSDKAIQNQKDDLREIKSIYQSFFEQMESVRYEISIDHIEPRQDSVEVSARYTLEGIVAKGRTGQNWKGQIRWVLVREGAALKIISLDYQPQRSK